MNNAENLLPIGSIVLLTGGTKTLMIIGYGIEVEKHFDYIGVLYPEGLTGSDNLGFFNHKDIKEIINNGYKNETSETFLNNLTNYLNGKKLIGE